MRTGIRLPSVVAHADWGKNPDKRWLARAALDDRGRYVARAPEPVGDPKTLLRRLLGAGDGGPVFAGFDFPIGLPAVYAERAAIDDFLAVFRASERESGLTSTTSRSARARLR